MISQHLALSAESFVELQALSLVSKFPQHGYHECMTLPLVSQNISGCVYACAGLNVVLPRTRLLLFGCLDMKARERALLPAQHISLFFGSKSSLEHTTSFCKTCARYTGLPLISYIQNQRMQCTCPLLFRPKAALSQ
jgi:hypothetical protein